MLIRFSPPNILSWNGHCVRAALGAGGIIDAAMKQEGDGASPAGRWRLRRVMYRADRVAAPRTALPMRAIRENDGWCDDPADPAYNRPVRLPYPASYEAIWRDDHVYDILVVLDHNDHPPVPGKGSAIFLHLAREGYTPTRGCLALNETDMRDLLSGAGPQSCIEIPL